MKKLILILVAALALLMSSCKKTEEKTSYTPELKIYSIIHEEETLALTDLFTKRTGIPAAFLRASTGELVNRVIVEKNNPQSDILLGGASSYHIQADNEGALEPYSSPLAKNLPPYAVASDGAWTGFCVLTLGIGINESRYREKFADIPEPKTWEDLLNPAYKGEIVMTNPVASSTAYLFVQNQLQRHFVHSRIGKIPRRRLRCKNRCTAAERGRCGLRVNYEELKKSGSRKKVRGFCAFKRSARIDGINQFRNSGKSRGKTRRRRGQCGRFGLN